MTRGSITRPEKKSWHMFIYVWYILYLSIYIIDFFRYYPMFPILFDFYKKVLPAVIALATDQNKYYKVKLNN